MDTQPWTCLDLESPKYEKAKIVPTNNHEETLKLLAWTVEEIKPKIIWEFGPWMGHTTVLMALASGDQLHKIYSCDNFKWQAWMNLYNCGLSFPIGASFLPEFEKNTQEFKGRIKGMEWNSDFGEIPEELSNSTVEQRPDFVFVDFTRDASALEDLWKGLSSHLRPNSTVLIFNYVWEKTQEFFKNHQDELKPLNSYGVAGSYLFVSKDDNN